MTHIGESASRWAGRPLDRSCRILLFRHRGRSRAGESFADDEHWQDDFGLGGGFGWGALDADDGRHRGHRNSGPRHVQGPCPVQSVVVSRRGTGTASQCSRWQWRSLPGTSTGIPHRLLPRWSAAIGAGAGLTSFAGWALGVWLDVGPANLLWLLASGVMCVWLDWLGTVLARTRDFNGAGARD